MHSTVSDGTDTPEEILANVRAAGIDLFSVTDHDAILACGKIKALLSDSDPMFIFGVEFSCKDEFGKYHILGYGYDENASEIRSIVEITHTLRVRKMKERLDILKKEFGISFPELDIEKLFQNNNPGKPHLADLLMKYGYADSRDAAFKGYLNGAKIPNVYVRPEEAIHAIKQSGGIPVLAHPSFGSGSEHITGAEMENRILRLMDFGLEGLEAYYSGFTPDLQAELLRYAEKYDLNVTAGSDYHGERKRVQIGDNHLENAAQGPRGLLKFSEIVDIL